MIAMWFIKHLIAQYAIYLSLAFPVFLLVLIARRRWNSELANRVHAWRWAYVAMLTPTVLVWAMLALERAGVKLGGGDEGSGFTALGWFYIFLLLGGILLHVLALLLFLVQAARSFRLK